MKFESIIVIRISSLKQENIKSKHAHKTTNTQLDLYLTIVHYYLRSIISLLNINLLGILELILRVSVHI
jgi:hypothetical protein